MRRSAAHSTSAGATAATAKPGGVPAMVTGDGEVALRSRPVDQASWTRWCE